MFVLRNSIRVGLNKSKTVALGSWNTSLSKVSTDLVREFPPFSNGFWKIIKSIWLRKMSYIIEIKGRAFVSCFPCHSQSATKIVKITMTMTRKTKYKVGNKVWFIKIRTAHKLSLWLYLYLWIRLLLPSIPHFNGLSMRNLLYEIRICNKIHNKVTMTVYLWFDFFLNPYMKF